MTEHPDDPIGDTAAAELALGLLDGEERAGALRRVLAEPPFAAEVDRWRAQFALLFQSVPEVAAPEGLLTRIEASLDTTASTPEPFVVRHRWLWPSVAALTSVAAALLALLVSQPVPTQVQAPPRAPTLLAAAITPTEAASAAGAPVTAVFDQDAGTLRLSAAALAGPGRSAQLWVIGGDGKPYSLGLLSAGARTVLTVAAADRARLNATATLAVSIEPAGGSPTGSPTGPVVATGKLART